MKGHSKIYRPNTWVQLFPRTIQVPSFVIYWVDNGQKCVCGLVFIIRLAPCHRRQIAPKLWARFRPQAPERAQHNLLLLLLLCCCTANNCWEKLHDWLRFLVNNTVDWPSRCSRISWAFSRRECISVNSLTFSCVFQATPTHAHLLFYHCLWHTPWWMICITEPFPYFNCIVFHVNWLCNPHFFF